MIFFRIKNNISKYFLLKWYRSLFDKKLMITMNAMNVMLFLTINNLKNLSVFIILPI